MPPERLDLLSADGTVSLPVCAYPRAITRLDDGPVTSADGYSCE